MTIVETIERGDLKIEIDNWGGVHWHHHEDAPLSISPALMRTVEQARQEVLTTQKEADEELSDND